MKRPIDPNLNDAFDIDGLIDAEPVAPKADAHTSTSAKNDDADMMLRVKTYSKPGQEPPKPDESFMSRSERPANYTLQDAEKSEHSHHHRHHHSSGEHHHSGERHHSSGEHHHSSGEHRHSGEHHHSSGSHHSSHHHSSSHHSSKKKNKKKMSVAAKIALIFLLIILLLIFGIIGTFFYLEHKGQQEMLPNIEEVAEENFDETIEYNGHTYKYNRNIVSVAFIGVDKEQLADQTIAGSAGQADADIVFTLDTNTGRAKVIAIPRDSMVDVNLYSESGVDLLRQEEMQLCLSWAYGNNPRASAENTVTSIERILYNVPIEKYFALDLDGIGPINDAVGGVTVESLYTFDNYGINEGDTITLEGDMAQVYVRQRDMNDINASLNRTQRQIQYIKAFTGRLLPAVTNDFGTVSRLYNKASAYSETNINMSNATYLATLLLSKGVTDFETTTLKGEMTASAQPTGQVYAEYHLDETATIETVLDTFYTQID